MIYPQKVKHAIQLAKSHGLITRIATNAFWASNYRSTKTALEDLKNQGLDEINFSTGDDHSKWVSIRNVRNAAVISARLGFIPIINIETHDNASPNILRKFGHDKVFMELVKKGRIKIERGAWMRFNDNSSITHKDCIPSIRFDPCSSLFSMIPINPYGEVFACCGLPCEHIPYLRLGHFDTEPIKTKYLKSFNDLLKIWLFVDGPAKILKFIHEKQGLPFTISPGHICDFCRTLFSTPTHIDFLKKNYKSYIGDVIFKYSLYTNNTQKHT